MQSMKISGVWGIRPLYDESQVKIQYQANWKKEILHYSSLFIFRTSWVATSNSEVALS